MTNHEDDEAPGGRESDGGPEESTSAEDLG